LQTELIADAVIRKGFNVATETIVEMPDIRNARCSPENNFNSENVS